MINQIKKNYVKCFHASCVMIQFLLLILSRTNDEIRELKATLKKKNITIYSLCSDSILLIRANETIVSPNDPPVCPRVKPRD